MEDLTKEQAIQKAVSRIDGVSRFFGWFEIKELPNVLEEDELPERIIQGMYGGTNALVVATNKRLLFLSKGLFSSMEVEELTYDEIDSIDYECGWALGRMTIYTSDSEMTVESLPVEQLPGFVEHVQARSGVVAPASAPDTQETAASAPASPPDTQATAASAPASASQTQATATSAPTPEDDPLSRLERLVKLRDQGAITEDEYQTLKKYLLSKL